MSAPNQIIGQYKIIEQTGAGGMATVFKAYHERLDRNVAIKVMHQNFSQDPDFLNRFAREARIVARLEHPNIVPIYDYDEHNGKPYLVMKFVEGRTLKDMLRKGALPLDEIMRVVPKLADALTYAHERGVLHRDVKPSNIIIDERGEPYLMDFGLARIVQDGESTMSADVMLGTPHYISPEQAQGDPDIDARADVYSLGVILYELVTGQVPFFGETAFAIVHKHIYAAPPSPSELNDEVPQSVERVLLKALSKNPADRYDSPNAMIEAFRVAIQQSGLHQLDENRASLAASRIQSISERTPNGGKYVNIPAPYGSGPPATTSSEHSRLNQFFNDLGDRFRQAANDIRHEFETNETIQKIKSDIQSGVNIETTETGDGGRNINIQVGSKSTADKAKHGGVIANTGPSRIIEREWSIDEPHVRRRVNKRMRERAGFLIHFGIFALAMLISFNAQPELQANLLAGINSPEFIAQTQEAAPLVLEPLTTIPFALTIFFLWGSGILSHALTVFFNTGARYEARRDELRRNMESRYGFDWQQTADTGTYVRQRNRIEGRTKSRLSFLSHIIGTLMFVLAVTTVWGPVAETLNLAIEQGVAEFPPDLATLPVPLIVFAFGMISVLIHGIVLVVGMVGGADARENAIQREIEREKSRMTSIKPKYHADAPQNTLSEVFDKPQNAAPHTERGGVRLTEDGEFTESFIDEQNNR